MAATVPQTLDSQQPGAARDLPELAEIQQLWGALLGVPVGGIAPDSHFMLLGGDSLQLQRMLHRLAENWGLNLNTQDLAAFSTPERLVKYCQRLPRACWASSGAQGNSVALNRFPVPSTALGIWLAEQGRAAVSKPAGDSSAESELSCGLYNCAFAVRWRNAPKVQVLDQALQRLVAQHPVLRSHITWDRARKAFVHEVSSSPPPALETIKLKQHALHCLLADLAARPFQLEREVPCRFQLLITGQKQVLLVVVHHAVLDAWSAQVLLRDLLHEVARGKQPPASGQVSSAYPDYCWRQSDSAESVNISQHETAGLPHFPALTSLTTESGPYRTRSLTMKLSTSVWRRLAQAAAQQELSMFSGCVAAFCLSMRRELGTREISVAVPVSQRSRASEESSVGCYIRVQVGSLSSTQLDDLARPDRDQHRGRLHALHESLAGQLQTPGLALTQLAQGADATLASGNQITDILFAFQNHPPLASQALERTSRRWHLPMPLADYPLSMDISTADDGCTMQLRYASEHFTGDQMWSLLFGLRRCLMRLLR